MGDLVLLAWGSLLPRTQVRRGLAAPLFLCYNYVV